MAKIRNKRIRSLDQEYLKRLQEEYEEYGAWDTSLEPGVLTIYALHRKYQNRKSRKQRKKDHARNKRNEKFERRS